MMTEIDLNRTKPGIEAICDKAFTVLGDSDEQSLRPENIDLCLEIKEQIERALSAGELDPFEVFWNLPKEVESITVADYKRIIKARVLNAMIDKYQMGIRILGRDFNAWSNASDNDTISSEQTQGAVADTLNKYVGGQIGTSEIFDGSHFEACSDMGDAQLQARMFFGNSYKITRSQGDRSLITQRASIEASLENLTSGEDFKTQYISALRSILGNKAPGSDDEPMGEAAFSILRETSGSDGSGPSKALSCFENVVFDMVFHDKTRPLCLAMSLFFQSSQSLQGLADDVWKQHKSTQYIFSPTNLFEEAA